ncbi:MAG: DUF4837 family protein [Flavobacteriales bacterium]|nr:DUF4837 family protein [Flavobacteriales bacterium]
MAKHLSFLAFVLILFSSCESGSTYKMASSGLSGELIVIMEDNYWNGALGDTARWYLEDVQPGLPQQEYLFNIGQYDHDGFSKIVKGHRNIILFEVGLKYDSSKTEYLKDIWASDQIVVKITAETPELAAAEFSKESSRIISLFNTTERDRMIARHKSDNSTSISDQLLKKHNLSLVLPGDCRLAEDHGDFIWITRDRIKYVNGEAHDVDEGIFIYSYPYTDDSTFTLSYLIAKRDSMCKAYVPGPSDGSYMGTETDSTYYPKLFASSLNGKYAAEIRGLYKTVNDYYGGPFISLSTFDEKRNRIVTVDCFVFAPKFHKREYLREMEAVCYSLSFP